MLLCMLNCKLIASLTLYNLHCIGNAMKIFVRHNYFLKTTLARKNDVSVSS